VRRTGHHDHALRFWSEKFAQRTLQRLSEPTLYFFCSTLVLVSVLYSCVGQAGASGYIALMALFGFAPAAIRPTALVLNVLVSVVVSLRFYRAGHFSWRLFVPFAVLSVPATFLGGSITLSPFVFSRLLGALLLIASVPFFFRRDSISQEISKPRLPVALLAGAAIGLLSGLTGVGGGILITPLLLNLRWADPKPAAAVSAVFIFLNSVAALLGHLGTVWSLPSHLPLFALAAVFGGAIGSQLGSAHLSSSAIYRILGAILSIAGLKLIYT
jgi:uncharacterized membrane protein YfcA